LLGVAAEADVGRFRNRFDRRPQRLHGNALLRGESLRRNQSDSEYAEENERAEWHDSDLFWHFLLH
jgi:hypothetical protein